MTEVVEDVFRGVGVEVTLKNPDDFLKVKETLQRIGIPSFRDNKKTLYQSCHILHKRGRYAIVHFLEMFKLDGRESNFNEEDKYRRDSIALMLDDWGLVEMNKKDKERIENEPEKNNVRIKVIPFKEKSEWSLAVKYHIGNKK
jgi:hypothetical protein